ncbi:FmdB family zinc ribbon protein [Ammonifex thiophilus]|uniref:Putative regulatory protein FmdB zinc ribbon domain-containing protein n=1 Tax=Ammonifex thiophilus TaxID=444093 RepID=A0A3D8P4H8_9THEO|nr:hypothetical protein DXX99_04055 [Ammonifex thiophilus]
MPIYDYKCRSCGYIWEERSESADSTPASCPRCGGTDLQRLFPAPNLLRSVGQPPGRTCCGREERCDTPPCAGGGGCRKNEIW